MSFAGLRVACLVNMWAVRAEAELYMLSGAAKPIALPRSWGLYLISWTGKR